LPPRPDLGPHNAPGLAVQSGVSYTELAVYGPLGPAVRAGGVDRLLGDVDGTEPGNSPGA
jgi:hypothetical protein